MKREEGFNDLFPSCLSLSPYFLSTHTKCVVHSGLIHGLTIRGREQPRALAGQLKGKSIAKIYSSPILRALQTAEILSKELMLPYEASEALREFDVGVLEGKSDPASWKRFMQIWDVWMKTHDLDARIEGRESFNDIQRRFIPFIEHIKVDADLQDSGIVLVGHGGISSAMLPLILENIDYGFVGRHKLDYATVILAEPRSNGLVCLEWGEQRLESVKTSGR